jgi:hypothetical protein
MPAKLVVASGSGQGSEFYIQDPVVRIGSGGQCEWQLADAKLAEHAATLEFRDGGYRLYNKSTDPLHVADRTLDKRQWAAWAAGEAADFGHGVVVRLEVDGDPAPAKAPEAAVPIEVDREETDESEAAKLKKGSGAGKTLQLLVIVAAVPLGAWMLLADQSGAEPAEGRTIDFGELVKKLEKSPTDQAREPYSFRSTLQCARTSELRGDRKEAQTRYGSLRDALLLLPRDAKGKFKDAVNDDLWKYVLLHLQKLQSDEES